MKLPSQDCLWDSEKGSSLVRSWCTACDVLCTQASRAEILHVLSLYVTLKHKERGDVAGSERN